MSVGESRSPHRPHQDGGGGDGLATAVLPDGTPDADFGTGGITTTSFGTAFEDANGMAITPDNKVVCVGMSAQTNNDFAIARYFLGPVINEVEEWHTSLTVYPNPTSGQLHIEPIHQGVAWRLTSLLGQEVHPGVLDRGNGITLDLSTTPSGAYMLTWQTPSGPHTHRIFVQH